GAGRIPDLELLRRRRARGDRRQAILQRRHRDGHGRGPHGHRCPRGRQEKPLGPRERNRPARGRGAGQETLPARRPRVHLHDHLARQGREHPRHADHQLARGRHPRGAEDREAACRSRRPDRDSGNDVPVVLLRPPRNRWSRGGGVRPVGPELPRTSRDDFRGYRLVHFGWVASEYSASAKRLRERSCSVGWWPGTRMSWSSERGRAGTASFMGPNDLEVRKAEGSDWVTFTDAIIATGGRPSDLPAFRFDGKRVISTKEALELPRIPQNFAIIGGGVSGLELGMFYAKLGSRVVVTEIMEQLLPGTDPEAVRVVARNLQKLGVEVHVKSQARGWREDKGQTVVDIVTPEGLIARRADTILVTVGRRPNTDDLHAEVAGVEFGPRGYVKVDRQLRTSNPHVFAIGDVIGPPFLAHKATKEGVTAAE